MVCVCAHMHSTTFPSWLKHTSPISPLSIFGWNLVTSVPSALSRGVPDLQAPNRRAGCVHIPLSTLDHRAGKESFILCDLSVPLVSMKHFSFCGC